MRLSVILFFLCVTDLLTIFVSCDEFDDYVVYNDKDLSVGVKPDDIETELKSTNNSKKRSAMRRISEEKIYSARIPLKELVSNENEFLNDRLMGAVIFSDVFESDSLDLFEKLLLSGKNDDVTVATEILYRLLVYNRTNFEVGVLERIRSMHGDIIMDHYRRSNVFDMKSKALVVLSYLGADGIEDELKNGLSSDNPMLGDSALAVSLYSSNHPDKNLNTGEFLKKIGLLSCKTTDDISRSNLRYAYYRLSKYLKKKSLEENSNNDGNTGAGRDNKGKSDQSTNGDSNVNPDPSKPSRDNINSNEAVEDNTSDNFSDEKNSGDEKNSEKETTTEDQGEIVEKIYQISDLASRYRRVFFYAEREITNNISEYEDILFDYLTDFDEVIIYKVASILSRSSRENSLSSRDLCEKLSLYLTDFVDGKYTSKKSSLYVPTLKNIISIVSDIGCKSCVPTLLRLTEDEKLKSCSLMNLAKFENGALGDATPDFKYLLQTDLMPDYLKILSDNKDYDTLLDMISDEVENEIYGLVLFLKESTVQNNRSKVILKYRDITHSLLRDLISKFLLK